MVNVNGQNESWYYYYADSQGSIRLITDSSGNIVESYTYDVYGRPSVMTSAGMDSNWLTEDAGTQSYSSIANPYMFTGRRLDAVTGLYYYRFRDYSPVLGRFLQTDPAGYIDTMNLYAYCGNNPVNWIDPWGLCKEDKSIAEKIIDAIEALENSAVGEVLNAMNDGLCAWVDGVVPFGDPLDDTYNSNDMGFSRAMGMVSGTAATTAAGVGAGRALGFIDDIPQANNYFRVISKPLKAGFRIDKAHHGKWIHSHLWRW